MEIWLKAKVRLWVSSSPFPSCYLTLQSTPSDSSRVCCSHRLDLQPNPWAGWAASTLLKNNCFKIFTQETRAVFSNDSKLLLPKPWGAQSSRCRAWFCSCVFTASHSGLHQSMRELCLCPVLAHWWPMDTQRFPALQGGRAACVSPRAMVRVIKIWSEELILMYTQYQLEINIQATGIGNGCPKTLSKSFHF